MTKFNKMTGLLTSLSVVALVGCGGGGASSPSSTSKVNNELPQHLSQALNGKAIVDISPAGEELSDIKNHQFKPVAGSLSGNKEVRFAEDDQPTWFDDKFEDSEEPKSYTSTANWRASVLLTGRHVSGSTFAHTGGEITAGVFDHKGNYDYEMSNKAAVVAKYAIIEGKVTNESIESSLCIDATFDLKTVGFNEAAIHELVSSQKSRFSILADLLGEYDATNKTFSHKGALYVEADKTVGHVVLMGRDGPIGIGGAGTINTLTCEGRPTIFAMSGQNTKVGQVDLGTGATLLANLTATNAPVITLGPVSGTSWRVGSTSSKFTLKIAQLAADATTPVIKFNDNAGVSDEATATALFSAVQSSDGTALTAGTNFNWVWDDTAKTLSIQNTGTTAITSAGLNLTPSHSAVGSRLASASTGSAFALAAQNLNLNTTKLAAVKAQDTAGNTVRGAQIKAGNGFVVASYAKSNVVGFDLANVTQYSLGYVKPFANASVFAGVTYANTTLDHYTDSFVNFKDVNVNTITAEVGANFKASDNLMLGAYAGAELMNKASFDKEFFGTTTAETEKLPVNAVLGLNAAYKFKAVSLDANATAAASSEGMKGMFTSRLTVSF